MLFGVIQAERDGSFPVLIAAFLLRRDAVNFMKTVEGKSFDCKILEVDAWEYWSGIREKMLTSYGESW
jgi:hypothetical protein